MKFLTPPLVVMLFVSLMLTSTAFAKDTINPEKIAQLKSWQEALAFVAKSGEKDDKKQKRLLAEVAKKWPRQFDWVDQDAGDLAGVRAFYFDRKPEQEQAMLEKVAAELGRPAPKATGAKFLAEYEKLARERREKRLAPLRQKCEKILFAKHMLLGGSHYAYTEALSDAQAERSFAPGSALCVYDLKKGKVETLIDAPEGIIRDPDISFDGKKILFSWKKSDREDDFHLYEMDCATKKIRQITHGLGFADYEGIYLPSGDILFNSTRCIQTTDCWHTETSSFWRCDKDGKYMRRLGFDQVATNYPQLMSDGRVTYTRWEYNDRGQLYPQPLFQMNPDGTAQTEFYGNNSWFPTTIAHARGIPGSHKVVALSSGHHSRQTGRLIIIDNTKGRQENVGVDYLNPRKPSKAIRVDACDQHGIQYAYPYAFNEKDILVSVCPESVRWAYGFDERRMRPKQLNGYGLYFVNGETDARELLYTDPELSSFQPIPLQPKPKVQQRASIVDYTKQDGSYFMQDVYIGPGLKGVPRGTIKKLRVIAIAFREADVCGNRNRGPAGGAFVSLPCAYDNCAWDPKKILGDTPVYEDGSAFFKVPSRTPVYFQCLDENNRCVQTMRSWSTLMPGESFGCVGCHENKNETPAPNMINTAAFKRGAAKLDSFYGLERGFSFRKDVQPILDKHCVKCHKEGGKNSKFILTGDDVYDQRAGRFWTRSYLTLTNFGGTNKWVNWISPQSGPEMLPPYHAGANKSEIFKHLEKHNNVKLSREELDKLAAWIDLLVPFTQDNYESNAFSDGQMKRFSHYFNKRQYSELMERRNVEDYVRDIQKVKNFKMYRPVSFSGDFLNPYRNVCEDEGTKMKTGDVTTIEFSEEKFIDRIDLFAKGKGGTVTLEFSAGPSQEIKLEKMAGRQSFVLRPPHKTKWVKITAPALATVECYGRSPMLLYSPEQAVKNKERGEKAKTVNNLINDQKEKKRKK